MDKQSRFKNISDMENNYNQLEIALKDMKKSFLIRKKLLPKYKKLMTYYESEQRKNDYDDVNNGKLNPKGPHGILSEDTIYDFYKEQKEFCLDMVKTAKKFAK